jgi:hypothetical protein
MAAYCSFSLFSGVAAGFLSMTDPQNHQQNPQTLQGEPSPEELEAAQAANEADALAQPRPRSPHCKPRTPI